MDYLKFPRGAPFSVKILLMYRFEKLKRATTPLPPHGSGRFRVMAKISI